MNATEYCGCDETKCANCGKPPGCNVATVYEDCGEPAECDHPEPILDPNIACVLIRLREYRRLYLEDRGGRDEARNALFEALFRVSE